MATTKRKRSSGRSHTLGETSHVTTKAELQEIRDAMLAALEPTVVESVPKPVRVVQNRKRVDGRVEGKRKRQYTDGVDDFELALLRHGINFDDLLKAARSLELGTHTPYAKLAHAVLTWWCAIPMGGRRIVWVDPASGYTEETLPKFSTAAGQNLLLQGLAGACWVSTRKQLLEARAWSKRMIQMTPAERLKQPLVLGDERVR